MIDDQEERQDDDDMLMGELRERLRASSDTPDAVVRARLSAIRARAIALRARAPAWRVAAGAALAASLAAAVIVLRPDTVHPPRQSPAGDEVVAQSGLLELLTDDDEEGDDPVMEAEFYEDLDVLTWLAGDHKNA